MADILNKTGSVALTDLKDSWELTLEAGKTYHFEAKNTDNHGRYNFVIESEELNYGEVPITDRWVNIKKTNVEPNDTDSGSFVAPKSVSGLHTTDPADQGALDKIAYIRVKVKWVTTIYDANYHVRIFE
jgi:hypothetical protein